MPVHGNAQKAYENEDAKRIDEDELDKLQSVDIKIDAGVVATVNYYKVYDKDLDLEKDHDENFNLDLKVLAKTFCIYLDDTNVKEEDGNVNIKEEVEEDVQKDTNENANGNENDGEAMAEPVDVYTNLKVNGNLNVYEHGEVHVKMDDPDNDEEKV